MRPLRAFFVRLGGLFGKQRRDREIAAEVESHLAMHIEDNLRSGMSAEQARREALMKLGGVEQTKENYRERRGLPLLETLFQDLHFGLRMLRKNPGFTAIVVLTLAVGIAANTTIFSWMRAVLLNPLPGASEPDRVMALESLAPSGDWTPTSYPDFRDLRDHLKLVESMTVAQPMAMAVGNDVHVERVWGEAVSGNFFDVLRVQAEAGRFFAGAERDDTQNAHPVVVISYSYWKSHFRADPSAIGSTIRINRFPYTIIGVAPESFHGSMPGLSLDLWAPATMYGQLTATGTWMLEDRKTRMWRVHARLASGISAEQARGEARSLMASLAKEHGDTNEGMSATLLPMWKSHYGIQDSLRAPLSILMGASGLVLLIVCANVANLLLARATERQKELSVRTALGASPARLVRQLITEVLLIAAGGSLAGLIITAWLSGSLRWLVPVSDAPAIIAAPLDRGVLFFTAGLALLIAALAGIAPAWHAARGNVSETLKQGGRSGMAGRQAKHLRALLVMSEMALAVVALIGAGLFLKSFYMASGIQPGFDPSQVALARFDLSAAGFDAKEADSFCRHLREQLERQPGIAAVSYADYVPLSMGEGSWEDLQVEGYVPARSENMKIYRNLVAPGYFGLLKIPLIEGRDFDLQDDRTHNPVMIVTREFVRRFVPSGIAVGRKVQGWGKWFTVVGVAEDSKIYRLTENPRPYFYVPIRQIYRPEMGLIFYARTSGPLNEAIAAMRREAQAANSAVPVSGVVSLNEYAAASLFGQKIAATLLSILAGVAFLLASIGLYGVMAYTVAQRINEIGIRVALGAQSGDVLRMIIRQGVAMAVAGTAAGATITVILARLVAAFLVQVNPADPAIYAAGAVFMIALAVVATAIPARRAMQVDPLAALRCE